MGNRSNGKKGVPLKLIKGQLLENNCAWFMRIILLFKKEKELWGLFKKLSKETGGLIEPVTKPVMRFIVGIEQSINKENADRIRGFLNQIKADISRKEILFGRENERDDALKIVTRALGKTKNNVPN